MVEDDSEVAFPVKDPSPGELAQKIDRIDPRLASRPSRRRRPVKTDADDAKSKATTAIVLGAIGIVVAVGSVGARSMSARRRVRR